MCDKQRLRPAWAYAQSDDDQSLCLSLEYSMSVKQLKLLMEQHLECLCLKETAQACQSLHLSKCHIVGNHMSLLIGEDAIKNIWKSNGCFRECHKLHEDT